MKNLRPCTYKGENHYFHMWFHEGSFDVSGGFQEGGIDVGAVLEKETGEVVKVLDITEIKFRREDEAE